MKRSALVLATAITIGLVPPAAVAGSKGLQRAGDILQIALPAMAAGCALQRNQFRSFAAGLATNLIVVEGLKQGLGNARINRRPDGTGNGFPSGHTAAAFFGATSLARNCFAERRGLGLAAYALATTVAVSRVNSGRHNVGQVAAGALVGYLASGVQVGYGPNGSTSFSYQLKF